MWLVQGSPYRVGDRQLEQPGNKEAHEGHEGVLQGSPQEYQLRALHHLCKILQEDTLSSQAPRFDLTKGGT